MKRDLKVGELVILVERSHDEPWIMTTDRSPIAADGLPCDRSIDIGETGQIVRVFGVPRRCVIKWDRDGAHTEVCAGRVGRLGMDLRIITVLDYLAKTVS